MQRNDNGIYVRIAELVSASCNVDMNDMLSGKKKLHLAQARWLYWHLCRFVTHDTYDRISELSRLDGTRFSPRAIGYGIATMTNMIDTDNDWRSRWQYLLSSIGLSDNRNTSKSSPQHKNKIVLQVPKNIQVEIKEIE